MRHWGVRIPLLIVFPLLMSACTTTPDASPPPHTTGVVSRTAQTTTALAARPTKVLLVVEENHTAGSALAGMPSLATEARRHGYASGWKSLTHPSLPNYLGLAGGSTFAVKDDNGPSSHPVSATSVFGQAQAHGRTARTYAEGMSGNCSTTGTSRYAVRHNPWVYFSNSTEKAACRRYDVPSGTTTSGALRHDVVAGTLPTVGMLVPDVCHDAHDCSLASADTWLKNWLAVVEAGPDYRAGRLAIVVTFDEDDRSGTDKVLTVVIAPHTTHVVSSTVFSHWSWTRYAAELVGASALGGGRTALSVRSTFHV